MITKYELRIMENGEHIISQMQDFRHNKSKSKMKDVILQSIDYNLTSNLAEIEDIESIEVVINIHHTEEKKKALKEIAKKKVNRTYLYNEDK